MGVRREYEYFNKMGSVPCCLEVMGNGGAGREHNPPRVLDLAGNPKFRDSVAPVELSLLGLAAPMAAKVLLSDTWHLSSSQLCHEATENGRILCSQSAGRSL